MTTIEYSAFSGCTALADITSLNPEPPTVVYSVFDEVEKENCRLHVPSEAIDAYKSANVWKDFFNIVGDAQSGIGSVAVDSEDARLKDVYNMQGILLKCNATEDDIHSLAPGLYIIRGKKVLVK